MQSLSEYDLAKEVGENGIYYNRWRMMMTAVKYFLMQEINKHAAVKLYHPGWKNADSTI